jgi:hypothetical protein
MGISAHLQFAVYLTKQRSFSSVYCKSHLLAARSELAFKVGYLKQICLLGVRYRQHVTVD